MDTDYTISLGKINVWTQTRRGVKLVADGESIAFDFITSDVLRLKISQAGQFDASPTFAIPNDEFGDTELNLRKSASGLTIKSKDLSLRIKFDPFHFDIDRADGTPVLRSRKGYAYRYLNNTWLVQRRKTSKDSILGLGEKTLPFNHNGAKRRMWNTDILSPNVDGLIDVSPDHDSPQNPSSDRFDPYYISINFHYHLPASNPALAAASYIDCAYQLDYDFSNPNYYEIKGKGGQLTEYIFAGPTIKQILSRFTELTGRMQAPPLWALGHHQCRWHRYQQDDIKALGDTYRSREIPCDTLWLDIDYMDGYRVFTWNREDFPDPDTMLQELRSKGFRMITIIDPGVKYDPGYPVFDEGTERNLFCKTENGQTYIGQVWPGRTAFPDFSKEETRQWWGRLNAEHVKSGLAGIWNDMNEPATGMVPSAAMRFDRDGANWPHERYHNQYAMLMAMGTVQGLREAMPDQRTFVLSRAGFAGIQRYAANWTGDNMPSWEHLAMSIPMNANLGISGQPFVGADLGGFAGHTSAELLIRWYQYGIMQPFMRNHVITTDQNRYPWSFGSEAEAIIKQYIELRYRLLPYLYSAFMHSAATGEPIQRPLAYEWQDDPIAIANTTEFMLGDHLLVAPVVTEGQTRRSLYLPKGNWRCFYTGNAYKGGRTIEVDAPLDHLPLFVRAGAMIPMAPVVQTTDQWAPEYIELRCFAPVSNSTVSTQLHEDDGLTDAHLRGEYLKTVLTTKTTKGTITISGKTEGAPFDGFETECFKITFVGMKQKQVNVKRDKPQFEVKIPR